MKFVGQHCLQSGLIFFLDGLKQLYLKVGEHRGLALSR